VPAIPAIAETLPGFDASPFNYIAAPAGTPAAVIARLNAGFNQVLRDPAFRARMAALGEEPMSGTPDELAAIIAEESARWREVIRSANIRAE
jgi:tripartite-type tricarboxylate transporter receptor subunit TctC